MDFGLAGVPGEIASSTSAYLVQFSPLFLLIAGVVLAMGVLEWFIFTLHDRNMAKNNETVQ
jgi:hypothetical protein